MSKRVAAELTQMIAEENAHVLFLIPLCDIFCQRRSIAARKLSREPAIETRPTTQGRGKVIAAGGRVTQSHDNGAIR
jgi:hypothetical protein